MGCPNQCVFCNQRLISGTSSFSAENVREQIESALATLRGTGRRAEIAFFGGSFTGIERSLMVALLDTAQEYVERGLVSGIRMSTRPDYIDEEILAILSRYTISCVELGIQSMSDSVLRITKRGAHRRGYSPCLPSSSGKRNPFRRTNDDRSSRRILGR